MENNTSNLEYCPYCGEWMLKSDMRNVEGENGEIKRMCKICLRLAIVSFEEEYGAPELCEEEMPQEPNTSDIITPVEFKKILDSYVIGQEHATKALSVSIYKHLLKNKFTNILSNQNEINNVLIIGPTGCGKTYLSEILAQYADITFVPICAADYTANGYVGESVNDIVLKAYNTCEGDIAKTEKALIFLDEIDKIKSNKGSHGVDVGGEAVQDQLLKIIGGSDIEINVGSQTSPEKITISTKNMLFIAAGAFSGITDLLPPEKRPNGKGKQLGFTITPDNDAIKKKNDPDCAYIDITAQELVKYGLKPEFVGRFPKVIALNNLKKEDLINILTTAKNNPFDAKVNFFKVAGIELQINTDVFEVIAQKAIENKTGARGLSTSLEEALENAIYFGCSEDGVYKCTVTKEMALDKNATPQLSRKGVADEAN